MSLLQTIKSNGSDRSTMGASVTSSASLTRSNDTVAYGAVDVVGGDTTSGAVYEFTGMGMAGADVLITGTELQIDVSSIPSGQTSYVLYLYGVTPPSALADNAAWDLPSGDRASFLGSINLGSPVDLGSTCYVSVEGINKQVRLTGTSLFGYLVTTGAFTPTASSVRKVTLHAIGL
jgi:hypothetical protein